GIDRRGEPVEEDQGRPPATAHVADPQPVDVLVPRAHAGAAPPRAGRSRRRFRHDEDGEQAGGQQEKGGRRAAHQAAIKRRSSGRAWAIASSPARQNSGILAGRIQPEAPIAGAMTKSAPASSLRVRPRRSVSPARSATATNESAAGHRVPLLQSTASTIPDSPAISRARRTGITSEMPPS